VSRSFWAARRWTHRSCGKPDDGIRAASLTRNLDRCTGGIWMLVGGPANKFVIRGLTSPITHWRVPHDINGDRTVALWREVAISDRPLNKKNLTRTAQGWKNAGDVWPRTIDGQRMRTSSRNHGFWAVLLGGLPLGDSDPRSSTHTRRDGAHDAPRRWKQRNHTNDNTGRWCGQ